MTYLVDSDWVIDHLSGNPIARVLIASLLSDDIAISIITYIEVCEGISGSRDPNEAEIVFLEFLTGIDILGVDVSIARRTGVIRANLRRQGRSITHRAMDLIIAATALERDLILVTRNTRDYHDIPDLRLYPNA